jgi:hypothetical protein
VRRRRPRPRGRRRGAPGALVDVWQANGDGFYDVQQPGFKLRGLFTADDEGRYWFRSVVPRNYPVPGGGPVGTFHVKASLVRPVVEIDDPARAAEYGVPTPFRSSSSTSSSAPHDQRGGARHRARTSPGW